MRAEGGLTPRRVLMTADAVGGVWPYAVDLAGGLRDRGIEVVLAVMGPAPRPAQLEAARRCGVHLELAPFRLEWMDDPWGDVDAAGDWLLELERAHVPDLVHVNGYSHASLPWRAPAVLVAHSCVCSWWRAVHGTDAPEQYDEYRARVARGLAAAAVVVAPSAAMLRALDAEYGVAHPSAVVGNSRAWAAPASATGKEPVVFCAARAWDEAKNVAALSAIADLLPWPVFIAGDTAAPDGAAVPPGRARHLGCLDEGAVRDWCSRAAIYALPARYEPFGLSVLEAALCGCALVLGDISSLRENWTGAAFFVPPDNRRALASAITRLIDSPADRAELASRAAARARQFTHTATVEGYLRLYAQALGPASAVRCA